MNCPGCNSPAFASLPGNPDDDWGDEQVNWHLMVCVDLAAEIYEDNGAVVATVPLGSRTENERDEIANLILNCRETKRQRDELLEALRQISATPVPQTPVQAERAGATMMGIADRAVLKFGNK